MITVDIETFETHNTGTRRTANDLVDEFHREREAGATFREIGDKHGISHERVRQVLESANITYDRNWASTVRKEKLAAEVNEWLAAAGPQTAADICARFNLSSQRLQDLVEEHGVPRRYVMAGAGRTGSTYTDNEIAAVLTAAWKRLKDEIPTATGLSVSSYDRVRLHSDPSPALITSRKPWKVLCDAAGVPCGAGRDSYKKKWTDQDLLDWIDRYADSGPHRVTFDGYDEWRTGLRKKRPGAEARERWKNPEEGAPSGALLRTRLRRAGYPTWLSMVAAATKPAAG